MIITETDFERMTVASMRLDQGDGHLWHRQFGRFEHAYSARPDTPPRKEWLWGHWLEDGWATVILARQFLIDNGHQCEIFFDMSYPTEEGGWVIFTDYNREHLCTASRALRI